MRKSWSHPAFESLRRSIRWGAAAPVVGAPPSTQQPWKKSSEQSWRKVKSRHARFHSLYKKALYSSRGAQRRPVAQEVEAWRLNCSTSRFCSSEYHWRSITMSLLLKRKMWKKSNVTLQWNLPNWQHFMSHHHFSVFQLIKGLEVTELMFLELKWSLGLFLIGGRSLAWLLHQHKAPEWIRISATRKSQTINHQQKKNL